MIIICATYLEVSVASTTARITGGDVLSLRVGVHWVYERQFILEASIFRAF